MAELEFKKVLAILREKLDDPSPEQLESLSNRYLTGLADFQTRFSSVSEENLSRTLTPEEQMRHVQALQTNVVPSIQSYACVFTSSTLPEIKKLTSKLLLLSILLDEI